jgi:hypothetical protein
MVTVAEPSEISGVPAAHWIVGAALAVGLGDDVPEDTEPAVVGGVGDCAPDLAALLQAATSSVTEEAAATVARRRRDGEADNGGPFARRRHPQDARCPSRLAGSGDDHITVSSWCAAMAASRMARAWDSAAASSSRR